MQCGICGSRRFLERVPRPGQPGKTFVLCVECATRAFMSFVSATDAIDLEIGHMVIDPIDPDTNAFRACQLIAEAVKERIRPRESAFD